MDFSVLIDSIFSFFQANLFISALLGLVLFYILYRWPGAFFTIVIVTAFLIGLFYLISSLSSTGKSYKREMIRERVVP